MLQREARFSKYQSQLLQIIFLWLGFSFLYLVWCKDLRPQNLIVFMPGLAYLITHFFLLIRRKKFVTINIAILFIGIIGISYLARYDQLGSIRYHALWVGKPGNPELKNKKVLVLEDNLTYFSENKLATPYLNWKLSEDIFRNPEYYENLTAVYHAFKADPPDVVIDKGNLLQPFLDRAPELRKLYRKQGEMYVRVSN
jgi:hypothetical protein